LRPTAESAIPLARAPEQGYFLPVPQALWKDYCALCAHDGLQRVAGGDPGDTTATAYSVSAEGVGILSGSNDPGNGDFWLSGTAWVTVADGRLTFSGGTADSNLCWVCVEAAAGTVTGGPTPSVALQDPLDGPRTYELTYDDFGNVTQDHQFAFTWDASGRLASATDSRYVAGSALHPAPQSVLCLYNATGVARSASPGGTVALDGAGHPIAHSRAVRFGWCGMLREPFTGLYHTHFREYSPLHGRWLSEDPAGYADGLNLYAYCGGDAVNAVDPVG
jgi:RHS repeat-associated protein